MALMDAHGGRTFKVTSRIFETLRLVNKLPDTPETLERKRLAGLRRPKHTEETKKLMREVWAEKNGVAKKYQPKKPRWKAISPSGEAFEFNSLTDFCKEHSLDKPTISTCVKTEEAIPQMQRNRFDTSDERKNTIGWYLKKCD